MKDIDWSKAPEGATHFHPGNAKYSPHWCKGGYFCVTDFERDGWVREVVGTPLDECVARPTTPQWNGAGLPPVGVVCLTDHEGKELRVEILAYGKHGNDEAVLVAHFYDGVKRGQMYGWIAEQCEFRPIRTPEQIAAEERETAIAEMSKAIGSQFSFGWVFEKLYDAGYRMTAGDER